MKLYELTLYGHTRYFMADLTPQDVTTIHELCRIKRLASKEHGQITDEMARRKFDETIEQMGRSLEKDIRPIEINEVFRL